MHNWARNVTREMKFFYWCIFVHKIKWNYRSISQSLSCGSLFFFFTEVLSMEIFENTVPFQRGSSIFTDAEYLASSTFSGLNIEFLKIGCFLPEAIIVFAVVSMRNLLRPVISSPYGLFGFQRHRIPCCSCLNLIITGQKCGHFVVSMQSW